eukprot:5137028-Amphidinium_carterae.1
MGTKGNLMKLKVLSWLLRLFELNSPTQVFGSYHKTGCELAENIIKAFSGKHSVRWSGTLLNQNRVELGDDTPA